MQLEALEEEGEGAGEDDSEAELDSFASVAQIRIVAVADGSTHAILKQNHKWRSAFISTMNTSTEYWILEHHKPKNIAIEDFYIFHLRVRLAAVSVGAGQSVVRGLIQTASRGSCN